MKCVTLDLFLFSIMSITAGEPGSSRGDMYPSSTFDFGWFPTFWEHQKFSRFKFCWFITPSLLVSACFDIFRASLFNCVAKPSRRLKRPIVISRRPSSVNCLHFRHRACSSSPLLYKNGNFDPAIQNYFIILHYLFL